MARLKVKLKGKLVLDLPLSEEKNYVAGRKEDCDLVLQPEKGISREHFKVYFENGQWQVNILSRFGAVYYKGEKVESFTLEHGQSFIVPPYEFDFLETPVETSAQPIEVATSESASEPLSAPMDAESVLQDEKTIVGIAPSVPYIKFVDKDGRPAQLVKLESKESWIAGRDSSSDVVIQDSRVSRRQFEIKKISGLYFILDLESSNGTKINGHPVSATEPFPLRSGDAIQVLDNMIFFELHDPNFKGRLESVHVESEQSNSEPGHSIATSPYPISPYHDTESFQPMASYDSIQSNSNMPVHYHEQAYPMQPHNPYGNAPLPPQAVVDKPSKRPSPIMILIAVLVLGGAYFYNQQEEQKVAEAVKAPLSPANDAFSKLPAEKQMLVKQTYQLARNYYLQGKYELAKTELIKMQAIIPEYDESKEIEKYCAAAIYLAEQKRKQEELEKARAETEVKILKVADECRKKISANTTSAMLDDCLSPVIGFNPDHPMILELKAIVQRYENDQRLRAEKHAAYMLEVNRLRAIYDKAQQTAKVVHPLKAIEGYEKVLDSKLPDPNGLKAKAERTIASMRKGMGAKAIEYKTEAEKYYQSQKYKEAIFSLQKARQIDPGNLEIQDKIDRWTNELRKQMMVFYQEGVLEESFGNVDGSESRQGAKEKWKKILELDIPEGEYYQKAQIKIRKYGAQ